MIPFISWFIFRFIQILEDFVTLPEKVSKSLHFRHHWRNHLKPETTLRYSHRVWIHGASLGELEDLAAFFLNSDKFGLAEEQIILTASSVSAQEKLNQWSQQQGFLYAGPLPPESKKDCREFLEILQPTLLVMSHTDIWPVLLHQTKQKKVKCLWIPRQVRPLRYLEKKFLVPLLTAVALRQRKVFSDLAHIHQFFIGNPRIDRIIERINTQKTSDTSVLEPFQIYPSHNRLKVVLGSAWSSDAAIFQQGLQLLDPVTLGKIELIVIPHDPEDHHELSKMQLLLPRAKIVPVTGILLEAFEDFDIAYIGGGFHRALHSVLEPALWGIPVVCGPQTHKQPEVEQLVTSSQLKIAHNAEEIASILEKATHLDFLKQWKEKSQINAAELSKEKGAGKIVADTVLNYFKNS